MADLRAAGDAGDRPLVAVVLAAGKGTRLRSRRPKVLHEVAGRPMLERVLAAAAAAGCRRRLVVVGHGAGEIRTTVHGEDLGWVEQAEQRGTGHALAQVAAALDGAARLLVLSGDVPLVRPATLARLVEAAAGGWGSLAVARLAEPGSLGRAVVEDGRLARIVEAAGASPAELAEKRVNAGLYLLPAPEIFGFLEALAPDPVTGELYLTDALTAAAAAHPVAAVELDDPSEALGVNDQADLARAHRALLDRRAGQLQRSGVTLLEPARISVEPEVEVGADTVLHAGVRLAGASVVGRDCVLHQGVWLRDSRLGDGVEVAPYSVLDGVEVADRCRVGPFSRLRPGTVLDSGARTGNFVEVKNARLGAGVKANHLAYIGDAEIGDGANIGAGAVTCNYDGERKHRTVVGRRAFIGSDTMLVAPVEVGDEATTAAGSVITRDVPDGALAVERGRQRNVTGWAARRKRREAGED